MMLRRLVSFLLTGFLLLSPAFAEESQPITEEIPAEEEMTRQAIQASLMGDYQSIRLLAEERRLEERALRKEGERPPRLAATMALLSITTERPIPPEQAEREMMKDFREGPSARQLRLLMEKSEAQRRFLEARRDRRYEDLRRIYNGVIVPVSEAVTGRFFSLLALPITATDHALIGRKFANPEQRRELFLARRYRETPDDTRTAEIARKSESKYTPRRTRVAVLQTETNADRAERRDQNLIAQFWFEKGRQLQPAGTDFRDDYLDFISSQASLRAQRNQYVTVRDGERFLMAEEFAAMGGLVRAMLSESTADQEFRQSVVNFRVRYPNSPISTSLVAAESARAAQAGNPQLSRLYLQRLEAEENSVWGRRAGEYLTRPEHNPQGTLFSARVKTRQRFWNFVWKGENPLRPEGSKTAEEARIERRIWIDQLRGFFVPDMAARLLLTPLLPAIPRPEYLDAVAQVDEDFFRSPEGRNELKRVARAYQVESRYEEAALTYEKLGRGNRARKMRHRAARQLERRGDDAPIPRLSIPFYERLLRAYPQYRHRARVRQKLTDARIELRTIITFTKEELRAWPELWEGQGFRLSPTLLDGKRSNGEITREGITLLRGGEYRYVDRATGEAVTVSMESADFEEVLSLAIPRKRSTEAWEALMERRSRGRIPLALEAGAVPDFTFYPSLVPLHTDAYQRDLYE